MIEVRKEQLSIRTTKHFWLLLVWCHMHRSSQKCLEVLLISTSVMYRNSVCPLYKVTCVFVFPLIWLKVNLPCVTTNTQKTKTNICFPVTH